MTASGYNFSATVTTGAAQLSTVAKNTQYGFTIKSKAANTTKIHFGYTSSVTAGTAAATDGMELSPGEAYYIPRAAALDVDSLYVISTSGSPVLFVEGC